MNLGTLRAGISKNRVALGALGVLAVGAMAWRARSTGTTSSTGTQPAGTSTTPSYYTSGTAGTYDTTATDLYSAIQPQLEALQQAYDRLPVPGTTTTPGESPVQAWVRKTGTERVYAALADGTLKTIDRADWIAAGSPSWTDLDGADPVWSRPSSSASTTT